MVNAPEHFPIRPSWRCVVDGEPYPCAQGVAHLLTLAPPVRERIARAYRAEASRELIASPAQLDQRFLKRLGITP